MPALHGWLCSLAGNVICSSVMAPREVASTVSDFSLIDIPIGMAIFSCILLLISICGCCKKRTGRCKEAVVPPNVMEQKSTAKSPTVSCHAPSVILPTDAELAEDQEEAKKMLEIKSESDMKKTDSSSRKSLQSLGTARECSLLKKTSVRPSITCQSQGQSSMVDSSSILMTAAEGGSDLKISMRVSQISRPFPKKVSSSSTSGRSSLQSRGIRFGMRGIVDSEKETQHRLRLARHPTAEEAARSLKMNFLNDEKKMAKFREYYNRCKATAAEVAAKPDLKTGPAKNGQNEADSSVSVSEKSDEKREHKPASSPQRASSPRIMSKTVSSETKSSTQITNGATSTATDKKSEMM